MATTNQTNEIREWLDENVGTKNVPEYLNAAQLQYVLDDHAACREEFAIEFGDVVDVRADLVYQWLGY